MAKNHIGPIPGLVIHKFVREEPDGCKTTHEITVDTGDTEQDKQDIKEIIDSFISSDVESRKKTRPISKFPSPSDLTWEDISLTFFSNEGVIVKAKGIEKRYTFVELGFKDGRKGDVPDSRWTVLRDVFGTNRKVDWSIHINRNTRNRIKKCVSNIRNNLKTFFNIEGDPFHPYRVHGAYIPKFTIRDIRHIEKEATPDSDSN